jgi:dimethylamine monooxygenase subunit B
VTANGTSAINTEMAVRVTAITPVAAAIKRFTLVRTDSEPLPVFAPGAHVVVSMVDGGRLRRNPYSLMSSPGDTSQYEISVLRVEQSRGGSAYLHEQLQVGDELTISQPLNLFPIDNWGRRHLLVAGGVGITPFIPMMEVMNTSGQPFELYYSIRSRPHGAYWSTLADKYGSRVKLAVDDEGDRVDYRALLINQPLGTHLYICGPRPMLDHVLSVARGLGWPDENLHFELFLAPPPGVPFTVSLAQSQLDVAVEEHQSLLEAIEAAGVDAPYLCRGGACGQCETAVVRADGELLHNDHFLTDDEKASGTKIMPCVSRFVGAGLTLGL